MVVDQSRIDEIDNIGQAGDEVEKRDMDFSLYQHCFFFLRKDTRYEQRSWLTNCILPIIPKRPSLSNIIYRAYH
jgi:hypothetical protein